MKDSRGKEERRKKMRGTHKGSEEINKGEKSWDHILSVWFKTNDL